jgi:hypothetical protein
LTGATARRVLFQTAARFYSPGIRQADVESSLDRRPAKLKIADAAGDNEVEKPAASEKQIINAQISSSSKPETSDICLFDYNFYRFGCK